METIVCSAIRQNNVVCVGLRHAHIIHAIAQGFNVVPVTGEQGFLTSGGRFVDRYQAAQVAFLCGQISESKKQLFSEDIFPPGTAQPLNPQPTTTPCPTSPR